MMASLPDKYKSRLEYLLNTAEASLPNQRSPDHLHSENPHYWSDLGMQRLEFHNASYCISELKRNNYDVKEYLDRLLDLYPAWLQHYKEAVRTHPAHEIQTQ